MNILNDHQDALRDDCQGRPRPAHYAAKAAKRAAEDVLLPLAKRRWDGSVVKQNDASGDIQAAVTALIANMNKLENLILTDRCQVPVFMGIDCTPEELYDWSK